MLFVWDGFQECKHCPPCQRQRVQTHSMLSIDHWTGGHSNWTLRPSRRQTDRIALQRLFGTDRPWTILRTRLNSLHLSHFGHEFKFILSSTETEKPMFWTEPMSTCGPPDDEYLWLAVLCFNLSAIGRNWPRTDQIRTTRTHILTSERPNLYELSLLVSQDIPLNYLPFRLIKQTFI